MRLSIAVVFSGIAVSCVSEAAQKVDWLQFGFDAAHSGHNSAETQIAMHGTGENLLASLHPLYSVELPQPVDSSLVLLTDVATSSGLRDLLFMVAIDGQIFARDAADGSAVWSRQPGTPPNYLGAYGPEIGAAPAVDPNRQFVYSVAFDGMVHKWHVEDGAEVTTGGWPEAVSLKWQVEKASSSLTIATDALSGHSYLYVASGGNYGDGGDYQGHITAIDLGTGTQQVFNALCSDQAVHFVTNGAQPDCAATRAGVWGRGGVVYHPALNRIFFTTGNGAFDAGTGGHDFGDSVLALSPSGSGARGLPLDSYTPQEFDTVDPPDEDLGSQALAILPAVPGSKVAHLGVQGGKDGQLRLLNLDDLSGQHGPSHVGGELGKRFLNDLQYGISVQPTVWTNPKDGTVWLFLLKTGYKVTADGFGNPQLSRVWQLPYGCAQTSIIVNDVMICYDNSLELIDPLTGNTLPLYFLDQGASSHWGSPIAANGHIYMAGRSLVAFAVGNTIFKDGFQGP